MSHFIVFMPSVGLIDRPPESNVTPLPTSASGGVVGRAAAVLAESPAAAARTEPRATASSEPQRSASRRAWSQTSIAMPLASATLRRFGGERLGIHLARRLVDQAAREVHRLAQNLAAAGDRRHRRRPRRCPSSGKRFFLARYRSCPTQPTTLPQTPASARSAGPVVGQAERDAAPLFAGQRFGRRAAAAKAAPRSSDSFGPRPDDDDHARLHARRREQRRHVSHFLPVISLASISRAKQAAAGLVELRGRAGRRRFGVDADDQGIGGNSAERFGRGSDWHGMDRWRR